MKHDTNRMKEEDEYCAFELLKDVHFHQQSDILYKKMRKMPLFLYFQAENYYFFHTISITSVAAFITVTSMAKLILNARLIFLVLSVPANVSPSSLQASSSFVCLKDEMLEDLLDKGRVKEHKVLSASSKI